MIKTNKLKYKYKSLNTPAKAAFWFAFCGILQRGIQFVTTPVFTRLMTTEEYGYVSVFLSWSNIFTVFLTLNLFLGAFNNGMIQNNEHRDEYVSSMQGLVTVISLVLFFFYFLTRDFWNNILEMSTVMVSIMFLEILFRASLSFWSAKQRFEYKYISLFIVTLFFIIFAPFVSIISILLLPLYDAAEVKIYSNAFAIIIICLPVYIYNLTKGRCFFNANFWSFGFLFNVVLIPHYLSGIILNQSDRIMIQKMVGNSEAGIYSLAYSASMVLSVVTTSINQSIAPWLYQKLNSHQYEDIPRITLSIFLAVAITILIFIAFAPECVIIFGGLSYKEAIWIIPSVASSLYFSFIFQIYANVEFFFMKNRYITYASVGGAVLNIILNYYAIQYFGYIAAGYTTLLCFILFALSHCYFVKVVTKEYINCISLFYTKKIFLIGFILVLLSQSMLFIYENYIVRYCALISFITIGVLKRDHIIKFIGELKR